MGIEDETICAGLSILNQNLLLPTKSTPFGKTIKVKDLEHTLNHYSVVNTNPHSTRVLYNRCEDVRVLQCKRTIQNPFTVQSNEQYMCNEEFSTVFDIHPDADIQLSFHEVASTVKIGRLLQDGENCHCFQYKNQFDGDWKHPTFRCTEKSVDTTTTDRIKIFDFTTLQQRNEESSKPLSFDQPGIIFHLLRSILKSESGNSHTTSPWSAAYSKHRMNGNHINMETSQKKCTIGLLFRRASFDESFILELKKFRVGDASPGYSLHSAFPLEFSSQIPVFQQLKSLLLLNRKLVQGFDKQCILVIYRQVPPRDQYSLTANPTISTSETVEAHSYLWETYIKPEEMELPTIPLSYRPVAAPYHDVDILYPDLKISSLFASPTNLEIIANEALNIPQWAPWPEKEHHRSVAKNFDEDGDPIWTVFPLCHTFPAYDLSKRVFLENFLQFAPQTAALLKEHFGDTLRTALFSRMRPETILGTHTGWMDLANHVLRLHIPLKVPTGAFCGTWVDGCVELQRVGKVICFDDSKPHRAFNYSKEERIVLILDVLRHSKGDEIEGFDAVEKGRKLVPLGTSSAGHTDELDNFIKNQGFL